MSYGRAEAVGACIAVARDRSAFRVRLATMKFHQACSHTAMRPLMRLPVHGPFDLLATCPL